MGPEGFGIGNRELWFPTHFAQNAKWMGHGAEGGDTRQKKHAARMGCPEIFGGLRGTAEPGSASCAGVPCIP